MRRVSLLIDSLEVGGAQRVLTAIANYLSEHSWEVHLVTFESPGSIPFYKLNQAVSLKQLGTSTKMRSGIHKLSGLIRTIQTLRSTFSEISPSVILSFMDQANVLALQAASPGTPVIVAERVYPEFSSLITEQASWLRPLIKKFRNFVYRKATHLVVQTDVASHYFPESLRAKTLVIPNPVFPPEGDSPDIKLPEKSIIGLGRFNRQKRFDLLIDAFSHIEKKFPDWSLHIVGEGPERAALEEMIAARSLSQKVKLHGTTHTAHSVLSQADIFVLSSDYEGFPGVLCEAMASGRACLATNCLAGPSEIIRTGVDGLLIEVGNPIAMAEGLELLCSDKSLRDSLGEKARDVKERYNVDRVLLQWGTLLEESRRQSRG